MLSPAILASQPDGGTHGNLTSPALECPRSPVQESSLKVDKFVSPPGSSGQDTLNESR